MIKNKKILSVVLVCLTVFLFLGCSSELDEQSLTEGNLLVRLSTEEAIDTLETQDLEELVIVEVNAKLTNENDFLQEVELKDIADQKAPSFEINNLTSEGTYILEVEAITETGKKLFGTSDEVIISGSDNTVELGLVFEDIKPAGVVSTANLSETETATIYYQTEWDTAHIHYALDGSNWTEVPGEAMTDSEYSGYKVIEIETAGAEYIEAAFNDGGDNWDNNNDENYTFDENVSTLEDGTISSGNPDGELDNGSENVEIYYKSTSAPEIWIWEDGGDDISEAMGHSWPGPVMEEVTDAQDWYLFEIPGEYLTGAPLEFHFEGNNNEVIERGSNESGWYDGSQWHTENPDGSDDNNDDEDEITVYYETNWATTYMHYGINGEDWTDVPGEEMSASEYNGYDVITVTATGIDYIEAVFNDGGDNWDNNDEQNYILEDQVLTIENGTIITGTPNSGEEDDSDDDDLEEIPEDQINQTMYQAFYWDAYQGLWADIADGSNQYLEAEHLANVGVTSIWLPPAAKAADGTDSVGYDVYDFWDLGEFNQHGAVETRYGTRDELEAAIAKLDNLGMDAYFDVVFNHRMGGAQETAPVGWGETIESYTDMTLEGRATHYSEGQQWDWNWEEFNAVDWCAEDGEIGATLFEGKHWDNTYSDAYLMGNDVDYSQERVRNEMNEWGEWIINEVGFAGFRMDAIAHVDSGFTDQWLDHVQWHSDDDTFFVAEAWVGDVAGYLDHVGNDNLMAFDFQLRNEFVELSSGDKDLRWWGGLVNSDRANQAVTFIDNHDTSRAGNPYGQPQVTNFKNQAYAYILMREEGVPTVYARDYDEFGMADTLDKMIEARKDYAYGRGHEVSNNDYNTYSYVREGLDNVSGTGLVMMISDSTSGGLTTKSINSHQPDTTFYDYTGNVDGTITTDSNGYGDFQVREEESNGWSIWVPMD